MQPSVLSIQVDDQSDMFHKFSLLKDHDINYVLPTDITTNKSMYQGVREVDEREYRKRESRETV